MKPNIKTIPAVVILLAISALFYSVLFTANGQEITLVNDRYTWIMSEPNKPDAKNDGIEISELNGILVWEWTNCSKCSKKIHITESHFCLMQYIPTWPEYIELEMDIVFDYGSFEHVRFPKGTKIYFKDPND